MFDYVMWMFVVYGVCGLDYGCVFGCGGDDELGIDCDVVFVYVWIGL